MSKLSKIEHLAYLGYAASKALEDGIIEKDKQKGVKKALKFIKKKIDKSMEEDVALHSPLIKISELPEEKRKELAEAVETLVDKLFPNNEITK